MTDKVDTAKAAEGAAANFLETPEFKAAVAAAVSEIVAKQMESTGRKAEGPTTASATVPGDMESFAMALASSIAELSDQGTGRKRVAPEIVLERERAREEMYELTKLARLEERPAAYQLVNKVYLDEILIDPLWVGPDHIARPTEIEWPGVPNEAMRPINDTASKIFDAFLRSIGSVVSVTQEQELKVTPGGLVIKGRSLPKKDEGRYEGVRVSGRGANGTGKTVNVLGTLAEPAQQTAH